MKRAPTMIDTAHFTQVLQSHFSIICEVRYLKSVKEKSHQIPNSIICNVDHRHHGHEQEEILPSAVALWSLDCGKWALLYLPENLCKSRCSGDSAPIDTVLNVMPAVATDAKPIKCGLVQLLNIIMKPFAQKFVVVQYWISIYQEMNTLNPLFCQIM